MSFAEGVVAAVPFVWAGLVLGISFLEAPLKFRAPGVTLQVGLGIGRLVFRALNAVELVLAVAVLVALTVVDDDAGVVIPLVVAAAALAVQLLAVRPGLNRRSDAVLAGTDNGGSRVHLVYIALEVLKLAALLVGGIAALAAR